MLIFRRDPTQRFLWHLHFALRPVWLDADTMFWLGWIERRRRPHGGWEYRCKDAKLDRAKARIAAQTDHGTFSD